MREELQTKVAKSIERLKAFEPKEGYYLAFSGGKDSCVCKALLDMAGCKYDAHYRVVGIDPPELVRFIKEYHPDVEREVPRDKDGKVVTMWNLIIKKKMPPTRIARYCCEKLKEAGGDGRMVVTGVRWAESTNRAKNQGQVTIMSKKKKPELEGSEDFRETQKGGVILVNDNEESRRMIETCYKRHKTSVNPIIEWTDQDVWEFIHENHIPYCKLYDEGWERLGCLLCPMAKKLERERVCVLYPKYVNAYLMAFTKMLEARRSAGMKVDEQWTDAQAVFDWWLERKKNPDQIGMFDDGATP